MPVRFLIVTHDFYFKLLIAKIFTSYIVISNKHNGFPGGASGKESTCQCRRRKRHGSGRSPGREKWQPTPVFLPEISHGQRGLAGYSPWGLIESDMAEWLSTHTWTRQRPGALSRSFLCFSDLWMTQTTEPFVFSFLSFTCQIVTNTQNSAHTPTLNPSRNETLGLHWSVLSLSLSLSPHHDLAVFPYCTLCIEPGPMSNTLCLF